MNWKTIRQSVRIILAVARKDVTEALKNRTLLVITLGVLMLMLTGPVLSMLISRNQPVLVIYDPADTGIFQAMEERDDLRLVQVDSQRQMEANHPTTTRNDHRCRCTGGGRSGSG